MSGVKPIISALLASSCTLLMATRQKKEGRSHLLAASGGVAPLFLLLVAVFREHSPES